MTCTCTVDLSSTSPGSFWVNKLQNIQHTIDKHWWILLIEQVFHSKVAFFTSFKELHVFLNQPWTMVTGNDKIGTVITTYV